MVVGMIKKSLADFIDPRKSPGSQVHAVLQAQIVKGHFLPGQALSEMKLADELGVSRTPVREALIKLSEDGLVNIVPQSGTYVSPIDVAAVYDSQLIRESLECTTVMLAARAITPEGADELMRILDDQRRSLATEDYPGFVVQDDLLHWTLMEISGHAGVHKVVQGAKLHLDRVRHLTIEEAPQITQFIAQHEEIVDRVTHRDGRGARRAMRAHLHQLFDKLDRLFREKTVLFMAGQSPRGVRAARHRQPAAADD